MAVRATVEGKVHHWALRLIVSQCLALLAMCLSKLYSRAADSTNLVRFRLRHRPKNKDSDSVTDRTLKNGSHQRSGPANSGQPGRQTGRFRSRNAWADVNRDMCASSSSRSTGTRQPGKPAFSGPEEKLNFTQLFLAGSPMSDPEEPYSVFPQYLFVHVFFPSRLVRKLLCLNTCSKAKLNEEIKFC